VGNATSNKKPLLLSCTRKKEGFTKENESLSLVRRRKVHAEERRNRRARSDKTSASEKERKRRNSQEEKARQI
jgi:hypothetical protein